MPSLSDPELEGIAAQAYNMAKHDLELNRFNFLLASYHSEDTIKLHRMSNIEAWVLLQFGEDWLNDERSKDIAFFMLRRANLALPAEAIAFASAGNGFAATAKFWELAPEKRKELLDSGHRRHHQAVAEGLLQVDNMLGAIVQTSERVCVYDQVLDAHNHAIGKPVTRFWPQSEWDGRMKMY